jgi:L-fuculose-phosphate aldolase
MFVESMYYLERVARVPYAHPGSTRLGEWVAEKAAQANLLLLENHGVLAYDASLDEALMGVQAFELAAKTWITARSAGIDLNLISPEVMQDFLTNSGYRPRRSWPE